MKDKRLDHVNQRKYTLVEEERFESMGRQILHMSYALEDLSFQMRKINETIEKLGEQLEEVKKNQQPIIINPSPVYPYPTNIPQWEPYTTTWTTADINLAKKSGDAE